MTFLICGCGQSFCHNREQGLGHNHAKCNVGSFLESYSYEISTTYIDVSSIPRDITHYFHYVVFVL